MSLSPTAIKNLLLGLVIFSYTTDLLLDWLNYRYMRKPYPPQLAGIPITGINCSLWRRVPSKGPENVQPEDQFST